MAAWSVRGALQLGRKLENLGFFKPVKQSFRTIYSAAKPETGGDIEPGFNFGHKPFGAAYDQPVVIGDDGLPVTVDWSKVKGAVWSAPNQGDTGLCFMYAGLGGVRSLNYIKTREVDDPSTQQAIDCNTMSGGNCGGLPEEVLNYIIRGGGILKSASYPFTGTKGPCKILEGPGITIDGWKSVKPYCEASLKYAVAYQPVIVSIGASLGVECDGEPLKFDDYEQGVLSGPDYSELDHSVLLVGYGENDLTGELMWKLLNSYGLFWGRLGFFELARGTGQPGGALGILRDAIVPLKRCPNKTVLSNCESCSKCF